MCFSVKLLLQNMHMKQGGVASCCVPSVNGRQDRPDADCVETLQGITNLAPYSFFNVMSFDPVSSSVLECGWIIILDTDDIFLESTCCASKTTPQWHVCGLNGCSPFAEYLAVDGRLLQLMMCTLSGHVSSI